MKKSAIYFAAIATLSGCATNNTNPNTPLRADSQNRAVQMDVSPRNIVPEQKVVSSEDIYIPVTPRQLKDNSWLKAIKVDIKTGSNPVPMAEVLRILSLQGVSITSDIPLDKFQYSGLSLVSMDAETALRSIVASVGLDYSLDHQRKIVRIKPMGSKTWYLNIGNRKSSFESKGSDVGTNSSNAIAKALGSDGDENSTGSSGSQAGKSEVTSLDDFWSSLKEELTSRLTILVPEVQKIESVTSKAIVMPIPKGLPPLANSRDPLANQLGASDPVPDASSNAATGTSNSSTGSKEPLLNYVSKQVGLFSMNPETGAITVQAPHWILMDLEEYLKRVQNMYNTDLVFQGELIMLTTTSANSEGLDLSAFARFANNKYSVVYQNNSLGGVTLNFANGLPSITTSSSVIPGPLIGGTITNGILDGLQVFNAYLSNMGKVTTLQRPVLTTTSGVPADFRRTTTRFFNTVSQETSAGGTGSASVGTKNIVVAQDFGTVLRVNPRIDISTGLIRAQIELLQTNQVGSQTISQALNSGNTVQQVPTVLPIISKMVYSGEALLKDGDLIVMGGQAEESENMSDEGIPGLKESPLFGKKTAERSKNILYFALKVKVNKR